MTYTLPVSSQGQIVIPVDVRRIMGLKKGAKVKLRIDASARVPTAIIEPDAVDWVKRMAGIAKGAYGNVDRYIKHERASWDRSKPWP